MSKEGRMKSVQSTAMAAWVCLEDTDLWQPVLTDLHMRDGISGVRTWAQGAQHCLPPTHQAQPLFLKLSSRGQ